MQKRVFSPVFAIFTSIVTKKRLRSNEKQNNFPFSIFPLAKAEILCYNTICYIGV